MIFCLMVFMAVGLQSPSLTVNISFTRLSLGYWWGREPDWIGYTESTEQDSGCILSHPQHWAVNITRVHLRRQKYFRRKIDKSVLVAFSLSLRNCSMFHSWLVDGTKVDQWTRPQKKETASKGLSLEIPPDKRGDYVQEDSNDWLVKVVVLWCTSPQPSRPLMVVGGGTGSRTGRISRIDPDCWSSGRREKKWTWMHS